MNDPARRARLNAVKLATLVREHVGGQPTLVPDEFPGGAALMHHTDAWVLVDEHPGRRLGGAIAWALRHQATALHVVADRATGLLARRAGGWSMPIMVWYADERTLLPAVAEPVAVPAAPPAPHRDFEATIAAAGADVVIEHGVLSGEIEGLEVCRVIDDPHTGELRLEVGVGAHDREAFMMLHGNRPTAEALATVVQAVVAQRRPLDPRHPLGRLALERALRGRLVAAPSVIGAESVEPLAPPVPRENLKDAVPCLARATIAGSPVLVVCSVGIDLDAVPFAVDSRLTYDTGECLLVVPERDAIDIQRRLAALASPPVRVVAVPAATMATA